MDAIDKVKAAADGARRVHPCKEEAKRKGWTHRMLAPLWGVHHTTVTRMLNKGSKRTAFLVDGLEDFEGYDDLLREMYRKEMGIELEDEW